MKKIELIKEYQGEKKGHVVELKTGRADYLIRMGIARVVTDTGETKAPNKPKVLKGKGITKELKTDIKTK